MCVEKLDTLVGSTLSFDTTPYPLDRMIFEQVGAFLQSKGFEPCAPAQIHRVITPHSLNELYTFLYAYMDTEPFLKVYRAFIETAVLKHCGVGHLYQRKPGIRIHLPGAMTVNYHTDEWYGHGPSVTNFWMALTPAFDTNTLHVVGVQDSLRLVEQFTRSKADLTEMNRLSKAHAKPVEICFGEIFVFNAKCIHGSETNLTASTRISIDFRVLAEHEDPGNKDTEEYYLKPGRPTDITQKQAIRPLEYVGAAYFYPRYAFTRHLRAHYQRAICKEFARKMKMKIVAEETEVHTMTHHPNLLHLASGKSVSPINSVSIFSVACLPLDAQDRKRIYTAARDSGTTLFFANEQLVFFPDSTDAQIEQIRAEVMGEREGA